MVTIGDAVSSIRGIVKAVKEDAFITDRFIYSLILKYGKTLIRRQDNENKIRNMRSLFETLPCDELIEVDKVSACCNGIKSNCKIMRTKDKLPKLMEGANGPLIRGVSSIDNGIYMNPTSPQVYISIANSLNFKHNKAKYYWLIDDYLYFPNIEWDAINIEAIWEDSISYLKCEKKCKLRQDENATIPDYLFGEIEPMVLRSLGITVQLPTDPSDDKLSQIR